MEFKKIAKIASAQDGAIWNNFLFRFDHTGKCSVYDLNCKLNGEELTPLSTFMLGGLDKFTPHSNSVSFSSEYFANTDEFPLLFSNLYNNYQKEENRREGICCVYRITRDDTNFTSELIGIIEIAFVKDGNLWCSENGDDIRPYGNFVVDRKNGKLFAFTMRDASKTTRYFSFNLPKMADTSIDNTLSIKKVTLTKADIEYYFDCPYHHFVQGVCVENGKIYSLEGFTGNIDNPPAIRIISIENRCQEAYIPLKDYNLTIEPELIDFKDGICYYCDYQGNMYNIIFD